MNKKHIRKQIGVVPQDMLLFNKSVYDNIVIGSQKINLEDVRKICKMTQIDDEIISIPMGYKTPISECGQNLSGGQRQRLILARAIINNPKILLFDEATNSLDNSNERLISNLLNDLGCTRIIIAHRLSTIADSDVIIVLDKGKILAQGTHKYLLANNPLYRELYWNENNDCKYSEISNTVVS